MKSSPQNKFVIRRWKKETVWVYLVKEEPKPLDIVEFLSIVKNKIAWVKLPSTAYEFTAKKDARIVTVMLESQAGLANEYWYDVKGLNELYGGRRNGTKEKGTDPGTVGERQAGNQNAGGQFDADQARLRNPGNR